MFGPVSRRGVWTPTTKAGAVYREIVSAMTVRVNRRSDGDESLRTQDENDVWRVGDIWIIPRKQPRKTQNGEHPSVAR
jgi:hypothetical protein